MSPCERTAYRILTIGVGDKKRIEVGPANLPLPAALQPEDSGTPFVDRIIHNGSVISTQRNECGEISEEMVFDMEHPDIVVREIPLRRVIYDTPKKDHDNLDRAECNEEEK